jgi:signal transduction histidine kinase
MLRSTFYLFSVVLLFAAAGLNAGPDHTPIRIEKPFEEMLLPLNRQHVYCDSTNKMTFLEVQKQDFRQVDSSIRRDAGLTYWVRYQLTNATGLPLHLVVYPGRTELAELYHPNMVDGGYQVRKNGRTVPFSQKDLQGFINYGNYIRLDLPSDTSLVFYSKTFHQRNFFVEREVVTALIDRDASSRFQYFANLLAAFFVGGMLVMALYTAILSITIREILYYFYVGFILFGMMFYVYYYGFTIEWVWPESPVWDIYSFIFILSGTFIFWLLFTRAYLDTSRSLVFWDKVIKLMLVLNALPSVIVLPEILGWTGPDYLADLQAAQNILTLLTLLLIMLIAYVGYRSKVESARFFLLGNLAVLLGSILLSLRFMGIVPGNVWINSAGQFGFFLQLILFSVGLGERINRMRETIVLKDVAKMKLEQTEELKRRKLIEEKNRELEVKVKERTALVIQQKQEVEEQAVKLQQQNEELLQVNAYKDRLFSIIGHDLRNPIGTLNGVLDLLNKGQIDTDDVRLIAKDLQNSLQSIMEMLDNLLMWALQQLDEVQVHAVRFRLNELIEENIHLMKPQASQKNIELEANSKAPDAMVLADREMIKLVIRNLISNSLKFTEKGGRVWVSLVIDDTHVHLTIHDNGLGMSEDTLANLFTKQPDVSYGTENEKGTGLGLRLCHQFVQRNNGQIWVESTLNEGSRFTVSLKKG